jgi:hypothetical protein
MRCYDNGIFFTVLCSERDVSEFAGKWPCFGNVRSYWFQFDKRNGDLVDTNHIDGETDGAGIVALSYDCQRYGAQRLRLSHIARESVQ